MKITKWKDTRFWAIWNDNDLVAVVVYKKGAESIIEFLRLSALK